MLGLEGDRIGSVAACPSSLLWPDSTTQICTSYIADAGPGGPIAQPGAYPRARGNFFHNIKKRDKNMNRFWFELCSKNATSSGLTGFCFCFACLLESDRMSH